MMVTRTADTSAMWRAWCFVAIVLLACGLSCAAMPPGAGVAPNVPLRADDVSFAVRLPAPNLDPGDLETTVHMSGAALPNGARIDTSFVVPRLDAMSATIMAAHVTLEFESPNGTRFIPGVTPDRVGFTSAWGGGLGFAEFAPVEPGRWRVRARSDGASDSAYYFVQVETRDAKSAVAHLEVIPLAALNAKRMYPRDGDAVYVQAYVAEGDSLRRDVTWNLYCADDTRHWRVALHDDGRHADGRAGDGLSVAAVRAHDTERYMSFVALGRTPDGREFDAQSHFFVEVIQDLGLRGTVFTEPAEPSVDHDAKVRATVFNASHRNRDDLDVELIIDGTTISKQVISVAAGRTLAIAIPWTPREPGSHRVKLLVDPYGEPDDPDLHNNWREIHVTVR
jgi:hypothetical protein